MKKNDLLSVYTANDRLKQVEFVLVSIYNGFWMKNWKKEKKKNKEKMNWPVSNFPKADWELSIKCRITRTFWIICNKKSAPFLLAPKSPPPPCLKQEKRHSHLTLYGPYIKVLLNLSAGMLLCHFFRIYFELRHVYLFCNSLPGRVSSIKRS